MTPQQVKPLRDLDPLLFQGCHPTTGNYLWVSMLESPAVNGTADSGVDRYRVQINMSWQVKGPKDEVPSSDLERLAEMKRRAADFAKPLRDVVDVINEGCPVQEIVLADWPCLDWQSRGCITLVGDAAHAMTMYRGEAANHGILDAFYLWRTLQEIKDGRMTRVKAIQKFEMEMRERTHAAVLLSRQACLDAHNWDNLNENSAILKRRAIK